ncbi:TlpA family protein disulfide reductase [Sinomicrobium sp. M5D2P17]
MSPEDKIKIEGKAEKYYIDYTVKGSRISREYSTLRKDKLPYIIQNDKNYLIRDTLRFLKAKNTEIEKVSNTINNTRKLINDIDLRYIENNPDKDISVYLSLHYGKLHQNHQKFTHEVRNGVFKSFIDHEIARLEYLDQKQKRKEQGEISEGKRAPDFTLKNIEGNQFNLYRSNAEYVVLDFWGSWCLPCIKGFPRMKEYHKKYKSRVEFVGIACMDKEGRWKRAVQQHGVHIWTQLLNGAAPASDASLKYAVLNYPTKVIIDKEKKIIGVFEGESDDFYTTLDKLMK